MTNHTLMPAKPAVAAPASFATARAGLLQRRCDCKGTTGGPADECESCRQKRDDTENTLQRRATYNAESAVAPPFDHEVIRSPGQQSDPAELSFGNPHFGHDFSRVRVHQNEKASAGAAATGMPRKIMAGLEQLSGVDLSEVRVHFNSPEPALHSAFAYTQGRDIHVGPGQEKHLPHEGWHVVQQLQGRVKPTIQAKGVLINDDDGLEREADVMGAKAQLLGDQAGAGAFHTSVADASGAILVQEPFMISMAPTAQRIASQLVEPRTSATSVPVIQRVANFAAGTITASTNLAAHLIGGRRDAGFTPPTLNGSQILSEAAASGAINAPTLGGRSNANGTVDAWVVTVPTNEASFTMQVPSGGPWSTVTPKANVRALFASVGLTARAGCATAGDSTFSVNGRPTDADFAANVRTHEDIHAADHRLGFTHVIVPWDTKLEAARTAGTQFNGASVAAAEAALYKAMGGTPDAIARAQFVEWVRLNDITHRGTTTATGGTATPSNSAANATCTTSSMDLT